jgi:hypothetical protein
MLMFWVLLRGHGSSISPPRDHRQEKGLKSCYQLALPRKGQVLRVASTSEGSGRRPKWRPVGT